MQDSIIGYLLGALDEDELARFEAQLAQDPELQQQVRKAALSLQILKQDADDIEPPPGLAGATCAMVRRFGDHARNVRDRVSRAGSGFEIAAGNDHWTLVDMMVACCVLLAGCLLFFPAVNNSRYHAQIASCQNNLRSIGQALIEYSGADPNNFFPKVPESGNMAVAGMYAPTLKEFGFVVDDHDFFCPSSADIEAELLRRIPSIKDVEQARGETLHVAQRTMGGDYGYTLGVQNKAGKLCAIKNQSRNDFALMADAPDLVRCSKRKQRRVPHQNVLFESGGVRLVCIKTDCWCGDSLYTNDRGEVSAGVHESDAVIGASNSSPVVTISYTTK